LIVNGRKLMFLSFSNIDKILKHSTIVLFTSILFACGSGGDTPTPKPTPEPTPVPAPTPTDSTPDAFSFTDVTGAELSVVVESNVITLAGTDTDAAISIAGGEYAIDGGAYTSAAGTIASDQTITVRVTSANASGGSAETTLTIDTVAATFSVTSLVQSTTDSTPDAFSFSDITDAGLDVVVESNEITITGTDTDAAISIAGGEYAIDGGAYTSAAGTIASDQTITVRVTSANASGGSAETTLTIDTVAATFTVTSLVQSNVNSNAIAAGQAKFLGGVCCGAQGANFTDYWNQVTPENAGKWGSVESTRDVYNWTGLDEAYAMAKDNGLLFKMHVLVWGSQQPSWISALPAAEQLVEIQEWYAEVNNRYPDFDFMEVVNEFDNAPPDGGDGRPNYIDALRLFDPSTTTTLIADYETAGETPAEAALHAAEYDWIINSFQMARDVFPATTKLMINEYSVINTSTRTTKMIELVDLLKARNIIDAVGFQGHAFSTTGNNQNMLTNLDRLGALGLDVYLTELDIDGPTDLIQLMEYQRIFPLFWEHAAIKGITMWGYLPGHWREAQGAHLALADGTEKPALVWLRSYIRGESPIITAIDPISLTAEPAIDAVITTLSATAADGSAIADGAASWSILGGNAASALAIDAATGEVTVTGVLVAGENNAIIQLQVGTYTSMVFELKVILPGSTPVVVEYDFVADLSGWRGDYGTNVTVAHNASEGAAEITPDLTSNSQNIIGQIAETDYTGASVEYTFRVTQAQVDAGITAQGYIQTGAQGSYARIYGGVESLVAGENTFTFMPTDNSTNDILIIERVSLQLNGDLTGTDTILLDKVTVTFP